MSLYKNLFIARMNRLRVYRRVFYLSQAGILAP